VLALEAELRVVERGAGVGVRGLRSPVLARLAGSSFGSIAHVVTGVGFAVRFAIGTRVTHVADLPASVGVRRVAPCRRLAVRVAAVVVLALEAELRVVERGAGVGVRGLRSPVLARLAGRSFGNHAVVVVGVVFDVAFTAARPPRRRSRRGGGAGRRDVVRRSGFRDNAERDLEPVCPSLVLEAN